MHEKVVIELCMIYLMLDYGEDDVVFSSSTIMCSWLIKSWSRSGDPSSGSVLCEAHSCTHDRGVGRCFVMGGHQ